MNKRILRAHADEYGFRKLGIAGCSAGGHLASTAATHFTKPEERPDFQILFYPVISMDPPFTSIPKVATAGPTTWTSPTVPPGCRIWESGWQI